MMGGTSSAFSPPTLVITNDTGGRCIQRHVVDLSVKMAPKAVDMLTPLTDFVTVVRSDGDLKVSAPFPPKP